MPASSAGMARSPCSHRRSSCPSVSPSPIRGNRPAPNLKPRPVLVCPARDWSAQPARSGRTSALRHPCSKPLSVQTQRLSRRHERGIQVAEAGATAAGDGQVQGVSGPQGCGPAAQAGVGTAVVLGFQFQHQQVRRQAALKAPQHRLGTKTVPCCHVPRRCRQALTATYAAGMGTLTPTGLAGWLAGNSGLPLEQQAWSLGPGLEAAEIREALAQLSRDPEVRALLLFGSRARGQARPTSDLDLLLILQGNQTLQQLNLARQQLQMLGFGWLTNSWTTTTTTGATSRTTTGISASQ